MAEEKYKVLFSGKLAQRKKIDEVKKQLSALFKLPAEKIDALFKQKIATLQRNLDLKTAQKYVQVIGEAGAVCRIEPMAAASTETDAPPPGKKPDQQGAGVVSIRMSDAQLGFSPFEVAKLTGTPDGINFNRLGTPEIPFEQVSAAAVISVGQGPARLLLFAASGKRPFICEAKNIVYTDFPIDIEASTTITLRHFLAFLHEQNPSIILEQSAADFLSERPPKKLDRDEVIKLATGMGRLLQERQTA